MSRYWHKGVYGDQINNYFSFKKYVIYDVLLVNVMRWNLIVFYEETWLQINTGVKVTSFTVPVGHKEERVMVNGEVFKFKYPAIVADHYISRGSVENHNTLSHDNRKKFQTSFYIT